MSTHLLADARERLRYTKSLADRAVAQVDDGAFFAAPAPDANSIAVLVKHIAGNQRSRWTDFLTSDGEKPDRHRDTEFELDDADTRESLLARWEAGWQLLFDALDPLSDDDLGRTVHIRGQPHTVAAAVNRQQAHYAYHVGQIVLLARLRAGPRWETLSVPRGGSRAYNEELREGTGRKF